MKTKPTPPDTVPRIPQQPRIPEGPEPRTRRAPRTRFAPRTSERLHPTTLEHLLLRAERRSNF